MCAGLNDGGVTLWTCAYVHREYALPPLHYYGILLWCEEVNTAESLITRATGYDEAVRKAKDHLEKWPGHIVWSVKRLDSRPIEDGEVVHLGGG